MSGPQTDSGYTGEAKTRLEYLCLVKRSGRLPAVNPLWHRATYDERADMLEAGFDGGESI